MSSARRPCWSRLKSTAAAALMAVACNGWGFVFANSGPSATSANCTKPVYLTFDTGHMGVADLVADVLQRHQVPVTFFLARERTLNGGHTLDDEWAPWWRARAAEGHAFASHTWDHWVLQPGIAWRFKATQGDRRGQVLNADEAAYCEQLRQPVRRFEAMTGQRMAAAFRAPAGRTSEPLLAAARACGFEHVGWSRAGFLGDELDSTRFPNEQLLKTALRDIRAGDVLVAHLGIWDRKDAWAPAVLEPLVVGLKERGFCFRTLREHPVHGAAFARRAPVDEVKR
jgi:peptidoglycan/xylan/chitin deacetylase (PgdA/CDA1 family)